MNPLKSKIFPNYVKASSTNSKSKQDKREPKIQSDEYECTIYGHSMKPLELVMKKFRSSMEDSAEECYFIEKQIKFTDGGSKFNPDLYILTSSLIQPLNLKVESFQHSILKLYGKHLKDNSESQKDIFIRNRFLNIIYGKDKPFYEHRMKAESEVLKFGLRKIPGSETVSVGIRIFEQSAVTLSFFKVLSLQKFKDMERSTITKETESIHSHILSSLPNDIYPTLFSAQKVASNLKEIKEVQHDIESNFEPLKRDIFRYSKTHLGYT